MLSRGQQLVKLVTQTEFQPNTVSNNNWKNEAPREIPLILSQQVSVLNEQTGVFEFVEYDGEDNDYSSDLILDEKTGTFMKNLDLNGQESTETNYDSTSSYHPSSSSLDYTSNSSDYQSFNLDETSGLTINKKRKKGRGKPEKWVKNKTKKARKEGKQYYTDKKVKGVIIGKQLREKRKLKPACVSHSKCSIITEAQRKEIFTSFWKKMSWEQRKVMICNLVQKCAVARRTKSDASRRSASYKYHLKIENVLIPVCKTMFLNTFALGEWTVHHWTKECNDFGVPSQNSNVAKKVSAINIKKQKHVRDFLEKLPKLESHYCRKKTDKLYVDMSYTSFKDIYKTYNQYLIDNRIPLEEKSSYILFLKVAHNLNIGLYKPKKDQCDLCFSFKNGNIDLETYNEHVQNKKKARLEKEKDKVRAMNDEVNAFTLDVQAVQLVPHIAASAVYFKQKLAVHQFTFFNLKTSEVYCYVWHEGEGGMDSNIFASCVSNFFDNFVDLSMPTVLFSDGCSAQNRNINLANLLQLIAIKYNTTIYQKYLTVGHTQMECDSVHSTIERKKKFKEIYVPADFIRIIREARVSGPYKVIYVDHTFFKDFSKINFYKSIRPGTKTGDPQVIDIKCLKYDSTGLYFKLDYNDEWKLLPQRKSKIDILNNDVVVPLYSSSLPIPLRKFNDLQSLKRLIPQDYHSFYDNLSVNLNEKLN